MIYDLVVLGAGPAGAESAKVASKQGLSVILIEKENLGGTCLNRGCMPTKSFYVDVMEHCAPIKDMWKKKEQLLPRFRQGISMSMEKAGVTVLKGSASIIDVKGDTKKLEVTKTDGKTVVSGRKLMIATGGHSIMLDCDISQLPLNAVVAGDHAINDPEIWDPERNQSVKTIAITGAGVIAVEMAGMLNAMGKEVVMLKHSDQILRRNDEDIKSELKVQIKKRGITTFDYFKIDKIEKEDRLHIYGTSENKPADIFCDKIIVASSMKPNIEGYGLEDSGINFTEKGIIVDEYMKTNIDGVYAAGDCTGGMMLAHLAEYQAFSAIQHMTGTGNYCVDPDKVPACIFFEPQIATVGLTEREANKRGIEIEIGRSEFAFNGMAMSMNKLDGFIKIIAEKQSGRIVGVHMIGPDTANLIAEATLAVQHNMTVREMAYTIHAHPTLPEAVKDALFDILEKDLIASS